MILTTSNDATVRHFLRETHHSLGLGAKWIDVRKGNTSGLGIAAIGARRLAASLKVESQGTGPASDDDKSNDDGDGDDDDDESRARATAKVPRKRKRRSSGSDALRQSAARLDDDRDTSGEKDKVEEDKDAGKDVNNGDAQDGEGANKAVGERVNMFDDLAVSNGRVSKKKKKKVRSRQKNLRKDKRPKDSLPAHLTEETLRAGRVRRPADGGTRHPRDEMTSGADV